MGRWDEEAWSSEGNLRIDKQSEISLLNYLLVDSPFIYIKHYLGYE